MSGSALRRQEKSEELDRGAHGTWVLANNMPGQAYLKGGSGVWAPGRACRSWRGSFPSPNADHTPEPDDVPCDNVFHDV